MTHTENPRLATLRIEPTADQCESLVLSLQAVFRVCGRDIDYDELATVTGIAFMATCAPHAPDPTWWPACGRHAFLEPAARAYGLSLRELHPPDAAPTPPAPPEFAVHFRDSYLPFVKAALDRDEPVLAWTGWPAPHAMLWGIITAIDEASGLCEGCSCAAPGRRVRLSGPPIQVYLVQGHTEAQPEPERVIRDVLYRAAIVMNNRIDASFGVISGPAALERWRDALAANQGAPDLGRGVLAPLTGSADGRDPREFHHRLARFLVCDRRSATRFLERIRDHADAAQAAIIDTCLTSFREIVTCMEPACDAEHVRTRLQTAQGRRELTDALTQAIDLEHQAAAVLATQANA